MKSERERKEGDANRSTLVTQRGYPNWVQYAQQDPQRERERERGRERRRGEKSSSPPVRAIEGHAERFSEYEWGLAIC